LHFDIKGPRHVPDVFLQAFTNRLLSAGLVHLYYFSSLLWKHYRTFTGCFQYLFIILWKYFSNCWNRFT